MLNMHSSTALSFFFFLCCLPLGWSEAGLGGLGVGRSRVGGVGRLWVKFKMSQR